MFGRLLRVTGTVLVIAVAFVTPVLATSAPASADTVVNGCTIVANPTSANFTNCPGFDGVFVSLAGDDLSYANLSSAFLAGAELSNANLSSANLTGVAGVGCAATLIEFSCFGPDLTGANLSDANLSNASLATCQNNPFPNLTACGGAEFSGADLSGANFTGAALGACLDGSCAGANFTGTLLVPSNQTVTATSGAGAIVTWPTPPSLPGASPGSCTAPSGSTFPLGTTTVTCQVLDDYGDVATGSFTVTVLRSISLVSIPCKKLAGCNLSGFDLSYTMLAGADLQGANLRGANLSGDVLSGADLQSDNLMGANLSGANLSGANLTGTNLGEVTWDNTTCPDGTNSDNDGGTCVGHL